MNYTFSCFWTSFIEVEALFKVFCTRRKDPPAWVFFFFKKNNNLTCLYEQISDLKVCLGEVCLVCKHTRCSSLPLLVDYKKQTQNNISIHKNNEHFYICSHSTASVLFPLNTPNDKNCIILVLKRHWVCYSHRQDSAVSLYFSTSITNK